MNTDTTAPESTPRSNAAGPAPLATAAQLADPGHPHHAAYNWGKFFAIMATGLAIAAPIAGIYGNPKIAASITGASQVLGSLQSAYN
jgi:hypothetical protein